jgi:hypothetical protein
VRMIREFALLNSGCLMGTHVLECEARGIYSGAIPRGEITLKKRTCRLAFFIRACMKTRGIKTQLICNFFICIYKKGWRHTHPDVRGRGECTCSALEVFLPFS